jgi:hypothetical protein
MFVTVLHAVLRIRRKDRSLAVATLEE